MPSTNAYVTFEGSNEAKVDVARSTPPCSSNMLSCPASSSVVAGACWTTSPSNLRDKVRNSSSSSTGPSASALGCSSAMASKSSSKGMSTMMVASWRDKNASSLDDSTRSFVFPLSASRLSYRPSMLPNCWRNLMAVFSPTPGMPGMLSALSPIMPNRSMTCLGRSSP